MIITRVAFLEVDHIWQIYGVPSLHCSIHKWVIPMAVTSRLAESHFLPMWKQRIQRLLVCYIQKWCFSVLVIE